MAGNINNVICDEYKTRYTYDYLNCLVREDNPRLNQTTIYKYDNGGNILLKKTHPYTLDKEVFGGEVYSYTYSSNNWKDQLVDYNGQAITYDEMGRPTQIGDTPLTWNKKGQLASYGDNKYSYNLNGIRTSKTVHGVKTNYYLSGNKILREMSNEKDIIYHYAMEKVVGFLYNNVEYIYERNVQGDILGIYQKDDLTKVAEYLYDAYGNHKVINYTVNNIGDINPIRYRGYYFDTETNLYYLNSRYYNPAFGRFISLDTLSILDETKAQINGLNLYMYCSDNPIMNVDPSGMAWWNWLISGIQILTGVILCATGVGAGLGASLIFGGAMGMVCEVVSPAVSQMIGGAGTIANGWGSLSTALSLFSFGPIGCIAGVILGAVGIATMAIGANDVVTGLTGTNYIQEWTGMSDAAYGWTNFGLNLASSIGTIAGRLGMRTVATTNKSRTGLKEKPYTKNVYKNKISYYDGKGRPSWSKHNIDRAIDFSPKGMHWHRGLGRNGEHIYSYLELLLRMIFGG